MRYLAELAALPRASVRIIPLTGKTIGQGPMNTFVIYDQRMVSIEVSGGEVSLRDPRDIAFHLDLFHFFESQALNHEESRQFILELAEEFEGT